VGGANCETPKPAIAMPGPLSHASVIIVVMAASKEEDFRAIPRGGVYGCHSFISSPVECAWSACSVSWIHRSQAVPRALPRNKEVVSRTSEVLSMRFSLMPALTALAFLAGVHEQAAARGWEFDCKYGRFAQDLDGPRATDFSMRFNFDDITNKAAVVGITVCLM
jgi:hypothetical protein